jgi:hypothetical protein
MHAWSCLCQLLCVNYTVSTALCQLLCVNCSVPTTLCQLLCACPLHCVNCSVPTTTVSTSLYQLYCSNYTVSTALCQLHCANFPVCVALGSLRHHDKPLPRGFPLSDYLLCTSDALHGMCVLRGAVSRMQLAYTFAVNDQKLRWAAHVCHTVALSSSCCVACISLPIGVFGPLPVY